MPIYEYQCRDCGKHLEKRQSINDAPLTVCQECGGTLEKKWSLSGFQFKGTGWYLTDYSSKGKDGAANGSTGGDTKSEVKSETKTDAAASDKTPPAKTETTPTKTALSGSGGGD